MRAKGYRCEAYYARAIQGLFATTPDVYPYHHTSAKKPRAFSSGRAKHVPSSCLGSSMTTAPDNNTAINGPIILGARQYRLAEASGSCQAMYWPSPGLPQTPGSLQSKRPAAPGPGIARIMDWTKTGLPQSMVSPNPRLPNPVSDKPWAGTTQVSGDGAAKRTATAELATDQPHLTDR